MIIYFCENEKEYLYIKDDDEMKYVIEGTIGNTICGFIRFINKSLNTEDEIYKKYNTISKYFKKIDGSEKVKIDNWLVFMEFCSKNPTYNSHRQLFDFCALTGAMLPRCCYDFQNADALDKVTYVELREFFKYKRRKESNYNTKAEEWGESLLAVALENNIKTNPLDNVTVRNIYVVNSISELMSASIQEIFKRNKHIKRCEYCGNFFVEQKHASERYCNLILGENRTNCRQLAKRERQKRYDSDISYSKRLYNSLKTKYGRLVSGTDEFNDKYENEYEQFKDDCKQFRKAIRDGKCTEKEYVLYLIKRYYNIGYDKRKNSLWDEIREEYGIITDDIT